MSLRSRTVLISFGSVAPSIDMPDAMKKAIVEVIKSYSDITFIWKYERPEDSIVGGVENLVLSRWMPQGDLLGRLLFFDISLLFTRFFEHFKLLLPRSQSMRIRC
ncbi:unnamed protein product [Heligmosomoides polygyrus]|uniref:glucuronosyltransferase n=1 Tax=Heligmosomoides polygyrus TaxID=6339 RepID=A0A3P7ZAZ3_HELPZ|nr:unnamed protein product [Heligmosomoides polygyrus]